MLSGTRSITGNRRHKFLIFYNVFDDVGGVNGFCNFLKGLNGEDNDFGHEPDSYYWANDLGWRPIMSKPEKIL